MKIQNHYMSDSSDSFRNKTVQVYKNDYPELLNYYRNLNEDNDEINFVNSEIRLVNEYIKPVVESRKTELEKKGTLDLTNEMIKKGLSSYNKIISFLEIKKLELEKESNALSTVINEFEIDLSDSKAVEKIIYLNELGIIDFLRTKTKAGISNGGLASVLSGITGIKAVTIKPSLNRLSSNDMLDNKHPYYTQKTVDKIKTFLIELGF
jgi:hypothetical protein